MAYDSSATNRLARIREAIDACLTAQQYSIAGRSVQRSQLASLRAMERELMEEINAGSDGGGMCSLAEQVAPSA